MQDPEPEEYWAFISYSSRDARSAKWLHKNLEGFVVPKQFRGERPGVGVLGQHLRPIFRDRDELSGSAELGPALQKALRASRNLIVLCSPNSARSEWVNKEIEDFKTMGGEGRIFALILSGEPNSPDPDLECFPPALRYPAEPLAGDLRKTGDGRERGFLKIVSGITGIAFADLFRRHERAKRRRQVIATTAAALIIACLTGLTVFAFYKERQAVKARQASDDLVAFMVDDLYESLRKTGRLNALESAVGQIQQHQENNPTSPENRLRTGLNQVNVLFETGHPDEASMLAGQLIASAANDPELESSIAHLHLSLADYLAWSPQGLDQAVDYANQAAGYFRGATEDGSVESLARALNYKGDALRDLGRLEESADSYAEAASTLRDHELDVSHIGARTHMRWGEVLEMAGTPDKAQEQYRSALALSEQGEAKAPEDLEWRCDRALALSKIDPESPGASGSILDAEKLLTQLLKIEFSNARWRLELAIIKGRLAESDDTSVGRELRTEASRESIDLLESLTNDNPGQPVWQRELVNAHNRRGHALEEAAHHRTAMELALENSHDPVMVELALNSIIFQMWSTHELNALEELMEKFQYAWSLLSEARSRQPKIQNLRFQALVEHLRLLPPDDERSAEIRAECESIIDQISEDGVSPKLIEHLRAQLADPR